MRKILSAIKYSPKYKLNIAFTRRPTIVNYSNLIMDIIVIAYQFYQSTLD